MQRRTARRAAAYQVRRGAARAIAQWKALPSGVRVRDETLGEQGDPPVGNGQTVRVDYAVYLADGTELKRASTSFKVGGGAVCEALEAGVVGMRVGDCRWVRAPLGMRHSAAIGPVPPGEALEYRVILTGAVHHMQIITLEKQGIDDPLQMAWDFGQRFFGGKRDRGA